MVRVEGRQIHENVLIANKLLDCRLKSKKPGIMYKIDFTKAFDHESWEFSDYLFERFGFGTKWRNWLKECWSTCTCPFSLMAPR